MYKINIISYKTSIDVFYSNVLECILFYKIQFCADGVKVRKVALSNVS